jgi:hypothetical protein
LKEIERMSSGWICRSRTDGASPEPDVAIVLSYALVPPDVVLSDVAKMLDAAPVGAPIRVITQLDAVHDALHGWACANGVTITHEEAFRAIASGTLSAEYVLDLQRA